MLTKNSNLHTIRGRLAGAAFAVMFFLSASISGQSVGGNQESVRPAPPVKAVSSTPQPLSSIYKGVKIGTDADEVRKLLGKASIDDKDGFFYEMDSEMVQIRLDENAKVIIISVTYQNDSPDVPEFAQIFGKGKEMAKADGSIYQLVRYPEAGYWIAYSKSAGDKPTVTVTMQKL